MRHSEKRESELALLHAQVAQLTAARAAAGLNEYAPPAAPPTPSVALSLAADSALPPPLSTPVPAADSARMDMDDEGAADAAAATEGVQGSPSEAAGGSDAESAAVSSESSGSEAGDGSESDEGDEGVPEDEGDDAMEA
jgi:hypothetical protein